MREWWKNNRDQWIPWEVSYSLKETSRRNKNGDPITSHSNAMVAVVLPDTTGSYSYYLESKSCCSGGCTMHHTNSLFTIIKKNKFNRVKNSSIENVTTRILYGLEHAVISKLLSGLALSRIIKKILKKAIERQYNIDEYDIRKEV